MSFSRMPLDLAFSESTWYLTFSPSYFLRSVICLSVTYLASFRIVSMVFLRLLISQSFSLIISGCSLTLSLYLSISKFCMRIMSKKMFAISGIGVPLVYSSSLYLIISKEFQAESFLYFFILSKSFSSFFSFYTCRRRLISVFSFAFSQSLRPCQSASFFISSFLTFSSSFFSLLSSSFSAYSSAVLALSSLHSWLMELRNFSLTSEVFLTSLSSSQTCFFSECPRLASMVLSCSLALLLRVSGK